ncbi:MAG TPA: septal ring lytic transglycosylase RlpA family protein [Candidatus Eisenbacteria bacterium]|nr:septal ring lytic transglycosylase RlpA family protein [Candidatus Eisenbacteria bacterium]
MLRVLNQAAVILLLVAALGAAPSNKTPDSNQGIPGQTQETVKPVPTRKFQVGRASWYGRLFQHKKTASGEPYDMHDFTAAHRTLPIGSWVKVTNLKNDKSVMVRINDRGPVRKSRILDLSYGAAMILGMDDQGIARVRLDVIETPIVATNIGPQAAEGPQ